MFCKAKQSAFLKEEKCKIAAFLQLKVCIKIAKYKFTFSIWGYWGFLQKINKFQKN